MGFESINVRPVGVFVLAEGNVDKVLEIGFLVGSGRCVEVFHHGCEVLGGLMIDLV